MRVGLLGVTALLVGSTSGADAYTFTSFDFPSAINTYAYGINNVGQVVGNVGAMAYRRKNKMALNAI